MNKCKHGLDERFCAICTAHEKLRQDFINAEKERVENDEKRGCNT